MKLFNFHIIKLTFFLALGILIAYHFYMPLQWSLYACFGFLIVLLASYLYSKNRLKKNVWFGVLAFITTVLIGINTTNLHNPKNHINHYSKLYDLEKDIGKPIQFKVKEVLKPGNYHDKYIVEILKVKDLAVSGSALLNIKKDSLQNKLEVDEILVTTEGFQEIPSVLNPNQFDYKKYLEKRYIYQQLFIENADLFRVSSTKHTPIGYASALRKQINTKLKKYPFSSDELAIINALILGQRQDISKEVYTNYVNAGVVHILAVSGLHVGILLLLLNIVCKPIEQLRHGKIIKMLVILILLWFYAIIAGASASIIRAATMFSVVAIGMHLKRPSNIYNTLAVSAFIILLFKPLFLLDVGFQLSYFAVLAIVIIHPLINNLWRPKLWLVNKLWQVFTVSTAAQFGVLPISLFYFNQFPGLFWLSNLVIIPLIGVILSSGILLIILALLNILPQFLADAFGGSINLMNTFLEWVASKEQFLIQGISFNILYVLASYFIIIALVQLYLKQNYRALIVLGVSIISFQTAAIYTKYQNKKAAFIVFHSSRNTLLGMKNNNMLQVWHNLDSVAKNKTINTFATANFIKTISQDSLQDLYLFKSKYILLVDSLAVYASKSIKPDYVLLRNSPKINLERLIDSLNPKAILADGSNYKSYITRWENTSKKRKLPFHQTGKKGAFIIQD